jgi:alpha/beta superfamily hydrolase
VSPASAEPIVVERVRFRAGSYRLEGELVYPETAGPSLGGVVIAGSHPLLGGNMGNNVVRGLGDVLVELGGLGGLGGLGWVTLRFNYRGVGRSEGPPLDVARHVAEFWETSHVPDEMDLWEDVQGAADFLGEVLGRDRPLVLIGYSFGCALLPFVHLPAPPTALVLVAPPLGKHACQEFARATSPLLTVISDNDFTLEPARLREWYDGLPTAKQLVHAPLDNHFFRGHEPWLVETVSTFLTSVKEIGA